MRKLLILLMMILLAVSAAAEEQTITIGRYTVGTLGGEDLVSFLNENKEVSSIKLPSNDWTRVTWKPGPQKDKFCLNDCASTEEKECTCKLLISGLSCILTADGTCEGVADGKSSILVEFNDISEQEKKYEFSSLTKLNYDIVTREFTIKSKEFQYQGRNITSEKPIKLYGDMITGDFSIDNFDITSQKGSVAETRIFPDRIVASKNTNVRYEPPIVFSDQEQIQFEGRKGSYEICLNEANCKAEGSYSIVDRDKKVFYTEGKSDGGPKIIFGYDSNFLGSRNNENTRFVINNLEDSSIELLPSKDVAKLSLTVASDKLSAIDAEPPVSIENGNTKFSSYADKVLIENIKGLEKADSAAMEVTITDKNGQDIIGKGLTLGIDEAGQDIIGKDLTLGSLRVIIAEGNQIRLVTADMDTRVTYNKMLPKAPLFRSLPNLKNVEGLTEEETRSLIEDIETLSPALTSSLKNLQLLPQEEIDEICGGDTVSFSVGGCSDSEGGIYIEHEAFSGGYGILPHELVHSYLRKAQLNNPEAIELQTKSEAALTDLHNLQITEGTASPEYEEASKKVEDLKKQYEDILTKEALAKIPIMKEWLATSNWERDVIKKGCDKGYCSDQTTTDEGLVVWADTGSSEPRYGVFRPYGCGDCEEDLASFVQGCYANPEGLSSRIGCSPQNIYANKLRILKKYGLIDTKTYSDVVPEEMRACMGLDVEEGASVK